MAASVRVEDEAFADRRYERLARYAGLADADHARGKMLVLWRQCTIETQEGLPIDDVRDVLGEKGPEALVKSNLGEVSEDGLWVRIKGTKGRVEWLDRLRSNGKYGKLGGRPKRTQEGFKEQTLQGLQSKTPPAPAPAPAPAKHPPPPQGGRRRSKPKSASPPPDWCPNDKHRAIAEAERLARTVEAEAEAFRDSAAAAGRKYSDWDAAFRSWLRSEYRQRKPEAQNGTRVTPGQMLDRLNGIE